MFQNCPGRGSRWREASGNEIPWSRYWWQIYFKTSYKINLPKYPKASQRLWKQSTFYYCTLVWVSRYRRTLKPIFILQKKSCPMNTCEKFSCEISNCTIFISSETLFACQIQSQFSRTCMWFFSHSPDMGSMMYDWSCFFHSFVERFKWCVPHKI